jgi:hypothetical protein
MLTSKRTFLAAVAAVFLLAGATQMRADNSSGIKPPADCRYGYFNYAPYACAPYGYYGPQWFEHGVFLGAGPWFHEPDSGPGRVDWPSAHEKSIHMAHPKHEGRADSALDGQADLP